MPHCCCVVYKANPAKPSGNSNLATTEAIINKPKLPNQRVTIEAVCGVLVSFLAGNRHSRLIINARIVKNTPKRIATISSIMLLAP